MSLDKQESQVKLSKNEKIKEDSIYLKGTIAEEIADNTTANVSNESYELLKFHGSYEQFDRDKAEQAKKQAAKEGKRVGEDAKEWIFMVRMKIPAGRLTAEQYLRLDEVASKYANDTLRITTRETFQFHYIVKSNLKPSVAQMNDELVSTIGACGDIVRNVIAPSAPIKDVKHNQVLADALAISNFTLPKTSAYHEIWLDGENLARTADNDNLEPLYGKTYLPRKFKIAVTIPEDNSVDALTHDLAIIAIFNKDKLEGYSFYLGGGMGMTHNKKETYPRLATPIAFVKPDDLIKGVEAVIKLQRDYGDRSNRKHARLKYLVEEKGRNWIHEKLEEYFGAPLEEPVEIKEFSIPDHMGWHEQGDGKLYLGVPISSGRIIDRGDEKIRSGLKQVIKQFKPDVILTADQNIILSEIEPKDKEIITKTLKDHGIKLREDISNVYNSFLACVALPTCGLALAEAERVKLPIVDDVEQLMKKHGLNDNKLSIRISGCPNGCSRPYVCEIGIVGRMPGHYAMFIGGDTHGARLNKKVLDRVPYEHLKTVIDYLLGEYVKAKKENEMFGDFAHRLGEENLITKMRTELGNEYKWLAA